jgi:hypothetical protein
MHSTAIGTAPSLNFRLSRHDVTQSSGLHFLESNEEIRVAGIVISGRRYPAPLIT